MDYQRIYNNIVVRAHGRKKMKKHDCDYVYYERHHVVPRCLGGSNDRTNLVYLTAEEHWLAHLLLVKIYPGNAKLVFACKAMSMTGGNTSRITNKMFGWIRREYSDATSKRQKGRLVSQEQRDKISATLKGRPAPHQLGAGNVTKRPDVAKKISIANKGKPKVFSNPELRGERISKSKKGKPNLPGELNPAFKGWIIATPLSGGPELRMSSKKDMKVHGFTACSIYNCLSGRNHQHKGYKFKREPLLKKDDN